MTDLGLQAAAFATGCAVGAGYLALVWVAVRGLGRGRGLGRYLGLAALRGGLIVAALALAIVLGIGAGGILAGLAGFVAVRLVAVRLARVQPDAEGSRWR